VTDSENGPADRSALGLLLVLVLTLACGGLLEMALPAEAPAWAVGGIPVAALATIVLYVWAVFLPERRLRRRSLDFYDNTQRQLSALRSSLTALRAGDLVSAGTAGRDLGHDFEMPVRVALKSLDGLVRQIQGGSIEVAVAAQKVEQTAADLASGSSQQAAGVVEITSTMEELARAAGQIATNASTQAQLSADAERAGDEGAGAVEEALSGMEAVRERMEAIASRTDALGRRSREIYGILDLINEIAQETHILALNAAIEASVAGEHGQRFAVVADEVRRLAERSRESVESVRRLLDDFSESLREAVIATEEGSKAATEVLARARAAATSIEELRGALSETAQTSREISLATQQQRTASDQVVLTLKEVSEVIQRMADGLKQFTSSAEHLSDLGLSIQLLTQAFRIDSKRSLKQVLALWAERLAGFSSHAEATEGVLEELLGGHPFLELLYVVDGRGAMVSFTVNQKLTGEKELPGHVAVGQTYNDRPWFAGVTRHEHAAVTPVYESLLTGEPCFTVATPIIGPEGELEGVLGVDVNVRHWTGI
jgi:methyl-accepting chemotaxis protein